MVKEVRCMKYKKLLHIVLWIALGVFLIYLALWTAGLFLTAGSMNYGVPEEGVWYCDDLEIQLSYSEGNETYAIIDGRKVQCGWINYRGAIDFSVLVQERNVPNYGVGDSIFWGKYISLTETEFVVEDCNSGERYVFVRQQGVK